MRELSILESSLFDEYERCKRVLPIHEKALMEGYIKGSLCKKNIKGYDRYYLQWRENGKAWSKYIPFESVPVVQRRLSFQKQQKKDIEVLKRSIKQIERALGKSLMNEYYGEAHECE